MLKAKIERKFSKSEKIEKSRFFELGSMDFNQIWREAMGHPNRRLCQFKKKFRSRNKGRRSAKKFSLCGADPQVWGGNPSDFGGIRSPWGVLAHSVEILAAGSKTTEISRVKEKHLAPPSGQTERRSRAMGPKFSSPQQGLQVPKIWR